MKPYIVLIVALLLWPVAAEATITQVQTKCTGGSGSTTLASGNLQSNVSAGNLLIVYAADNNNTYGDNDLTAISDTLGTTYTPLFASTNSYSLTSMEVWYGVTSGGGANSVSTTWTRNLVAAEVCVIEVSGATVLDTSHNVHNGGNAGDLISNAFSTTTNEAYVVWGVTQGTGGYYNAGADFTLIQGSPVVIGLEYRITSSTLTDYTAHITSGSGQSYEGFLLVFKAGGGAPPGGSPWITSGNNIYNSNSGNVGIGTSSPSDELHVSSATTSGTVLRLGNTAGATNSAAYVVVQSNTGAGGNIFRALVGQDASGNNQYAIGNFGAAEGSITFNSGTSLTERMRIDASGNLGIGTAAPSSRLHVAGDVTATGNISAIGNISARYQDLAEWVPAAMDIAPGTVVVLDAVNPNSVLPSSRSYDTHVAGVISATPGIVLGEAGDNKVKVATTGRVKVRVDATQRPIRIGDLLVTSDKEGMAMRSEPLDLGGIEIHRPGTLIGKALEPLGGAEGEILVLLSLQ